MSYHYYFTNHKNLRELIDQLVEIEKTVGPDATVTVEGWDEWNEGPVERYLSSVEVVNEEDEDEKDIYMRYPYVKIG